MDANELKAKSDARQTIRRTCLDQLAAIEPRIKARTASLPDLCAAVELLMKLSGFATP